MLVAVHPNYAGSRGLVASRYGNYGSYLLRLEKVLAQKKSIVFAFKKDKIPFKLPNDVKVIRDPERGYYVRELVEELRNLDVKYVDLGGEFLWFNGGNISENLKRYAEKLPKEKRIQYKSTLQRLQVLDSDRFARKLGLDPQEFLNEVFYSGHEVQNGCVRHVFDELSEHFETKIIRELCYPTVDPI